ncbi:MAG: CPBP family intramembrane glutamic endopeptidase [Verrucomicrobiia bacterium]
MRPLKGLIIYIIAVFVGSAILAPIFYELVKFVATKIDLFQPLVGKGFHRYLTRCMMGIAIIGLIPLFRSFGVKSLKELGLPPLKENWRKILYGFFFGFFTLLVPVIIAIGSGAANLNLNHSLTGILKHIINATLSAIMVAVLEEVLFRGGILGALRKIYDWNAAIVVSSVIYSIVHFFQRLDNISDIHWYSGFVGLAMMARGFADFNTLIPGFLNLFVAGAILGLFYKFTGNIYVSIGTHCGWIFWLKSYKFFAIIQFQSNKWIFGSEKIIDGWAAFFTLLVAICVVVWVGRSKSKAPDVQG